MKKVALSKVAKIDRTVATDDECLALPYVGLEHVEKESGRFAEGFTPKPLNMLATNFRFTPKHVLYGKLWPYLNKVVLPNFDGVCTTEILPILPNEEKLDRTFLWAILCTARELGDSLLQSVFLEMFGDVVRNEKGWEKVSVAELGDVQTGNTPPREEPENFGNFIEWIKSDNIRDDQLYVSQSREMLSEIGMKKGRSV